MQTTTGRWDELLGTTIEAVVQGLRGETRVSFRRGDATRTAVVARTRAFRSSLHATPSGSVDRVTPVFTDDSAFLSIRTGDGEELEIAGGRAWLDPA